MRAALAILAACTLAVVPLMTACENQNAGPATRAGVQAPVRTEASAVDRGIDYLIKAQKPSGAFGGRDVDHPAITGLVGIALLTHGVEIGEGPAGEALRKATESILKAQRPEGLIAQRADGGPAMYEHGFAALYLARLLPTLQNDKALSDRVRKALEQAVEVIENAQNKEGGWRYLPTPHDADVSVTSAQLMTLHAAKGAGVKVDQKVIDAGVKYVRSLQRPDGGFMYVASASGTSAWPRSAAAVAVLQYAGEKGTATKEGLQYLADKKLPTDQPHLFYGSYYLAHVINLSPDGAWQENFEALQKMLLARQDKDGAWDGEAGKEYATALALIVLGLE